MLYNVARGAALDGLATMRSQPGRAQRPLLGLRRHETAALCDSMGLVVVSDPMNVDPAFARVRLRHEVLPLLNAVMQRDVVDVVARQWPLLVGDAELLDTLASTIDPTDAKAVAAAPAPLATRAVRRWLMDAGVTGEHRAEQAAVERVLAVARNEAVSHDLVGDWRVERSAQRLRLVRRG
jgi:tRNA(Ile)-lysidine synthase